MQTDKPLLTIAIPTWNRPSELRNCVELLLRQSSQSFELLILDNASEVSASSVLEDLVGSIPEERVRIIRNRVNVGGDANILRCFEFCETEYVWILGDDDEPMETAVETILAKIAAHPEAIFFNFSSELHFRLTESKAHDLDGFIASIDSFSNILFTSADVFHCGRLVEYLSFGYHFIYAMAPHIVVLFYGLMNDRGSCVLLKDQIVVWRPAPGGTRWSVVTQLLGMGILLDLPLGGANRKRLARALPRPHALEFVTVQSVNLRLQAGTNDATSFIMDQIYTRLLRYSAGRLVQVRFLLYRHVLLRFPTVSSALFRFLIRRLHRGEEMLNSQAPVTRL